MKNALLILTVLLLADPSRAADPRVLREKMQDLVKKSGVPAKQLGLYVTSSRGEELEVLLDVNSDQVMIPASITKIATASAVLKSFPPGTKLKTKLVSNATVQEGKLKGDLVLVGGGDPAFVSENMWFLVNHFVRSGVKTIEGDILVDDSLFDSIRYDESRESVRVDRAYDAPVGAMSFNWNSVNVFVRPGRLGDPGKIFLDPDNQYTRLVNKTKTTKGQTNTLSVDRRSEAKGDVLTVSGQIGLEKTEVVVFKNITKPDLWAGENLRSFLSQRGIEVKGRVRAGKAPAGATLLAEAESKAIEQMVADMNKFSNNYVAEMLAKNLAVGTSSPASLSEGVKRIQKHLLDLGLKPEEFIFLNPSGLTRDNRFSAKAMWKILQHLKNDFQVQPEFLSSLPIAGIDGTLKRRMNGTSAERWVRAKTGLLTGVTALAGYAGREDGQVFTFVFVHNGPSDESRMRRLFDDWLAALVK